MKEYPNQGRPYLITRSLSPAENQEHPVHFVRKIITPNEVTYRRNHFPYPDPAKLVEYFTVEGEVLRPLLFHLSDLITMPFRTYVTVLECAGNKRAYFQPKVFGEQWENGAISQNVWKGVPLVDLLRLTGLTNYAREIVFEGHDEGERTDRKSIFPYARSLPVDKALHPDVIITYEYNGGPIPYKHGYPLRLIVPQWYGMASVKWLKRIIVIKNTFTGPFQAIDYNYYPYPDSDTIKWPVTQMWVNSTIQQPLDMSILDTGTHTIQGIAWTGKGIIAKVELSVDNGTSWHEVERFQEQNEPYAWTTWSYPWKVTTPGEYTILVKAIDSYGRVQANEAPWNRKGYGYNAISKVRVKVEIH